MKTLLLENDIADESNSRN